ncbi:MAG: phosphoribosyltransferase [Acidobacteria bacterium]|nr:phosphoribosyltransferase [Acidobacteriota bacterium]
MRFKDGRDAGRALAERVGPRGGDALVVAVARGGVAAALEVSKHLALPLDLLLLRRLLLPRGPLEPVCAANVAGASFLDAELAPRLEAEPVLASFVAEAVAELESRAHYCRRGRPPAELSGRTVVLVDNGVRTGSTMLAALRALRPRRPARVVAAAPVADADALREVSNAVEEFVCLHTPLPFGHVGLWYSNLERPSDDEIRDMLDEGSRQ